MPDTPPVPLAERLAGLPDQVSVQQVVDATGVSLSTARNWAASDTWPPFAAKQGRTKLYPRTAVEDWLRENQAAQPDVGELAPDSDDMLSMRQISELTGRPYGSVSAYPTLYGPDHKDPFPPADAVGRRRAADVHAWFSRRSTRGGKRATTTAVPAKTTPAPAAADVVDMHGIAGALGRTLEEAKAIMRRPALAEMRLPEKVGRSRVWPRPQLLAELRRMDLLPGVPRKPTAAERRWLAGGPKTVTEFADHYDVTVSAVMHRMERARKDGDPARQPPEPVDPAVRFKRYDPAAFDAFWRGGTAAS
ncbi:helix-turn-helix domain-containing protein [Catenulispora rubra]|uniref:helix-turn-helix domain-containing protein n=1 Tax=Catenulispora rubra TaxID=280293 RepID=UPI0018926366|nr:helix-turn-helix domain-containing protein [Catenulispora rubra]